jgi:hypothetical protein
MNQLRSGISPSPTIHALVGGLKKGKRGFFSL